MKTAHKPTFFEIKPVSIGALTRYEVLDNTGRPHSRHTTYHEAKATAGHLATVYECEVYSS